MSGPALADALTTRTVLLDGGLSTELERAGHDVSSALWSARLLRDAPEAVVAAHATFFAAGAEVATTASYQATFEGFASIGLEWREASALLTRSVALAQRAAQIAAPGRDTWVAASVGPYGAMLADGSEYTGAYLAPGWTGRAAGGLGVAELRRFHRPRLEVLARAGADLLACETVPGAVEVEALAAELADLGVPAWLSLTTVLDAGGVVRTRCGEPAADVFRLLHGIDSVVAVGVNCTDPAGVSAAAEAASASGKPIVVYPNSGERWDPTSRRWGGLAGLPLDLVPAWVSAGARLVGGCCRIGPEAVRLLRDRLQETTPADAEVSRPS